MSAYFGPAGNSDSFYEAGLKHTFQAMKYLRDMGLNAYEYQCGRGVNITAKTAELIAKEAVKYDIKMSLHAPYFISLSGVDEEKRLGSIRYILDSARAVKLLGGNRIVVHSGSCGKLTREQALEYAKMTVKLALDELKENSFEDVHMCLETMGKINQLGTLEEVMELCRIDDYLLPTIDFGHLNARTKGSIKSADDFEKILDTIEDKIGKDRLSQIHIHFSKIEYSEGGEKRHLTFEDQLFGPDFEPLMELIAKKNLSPTIICESRGTQSEDALAMKKAYDNYL